eukprot:3155168-Karenia_brevis.AAC.1
MASREGSLRLVKVTSHKSAQEVGLIPYLANHGADKLAEKAAELTQDGDLNLEAVGKTDGLAYKVLRRLV